MNQGITLNSKKLFLVCSMLMLLLSGAPSVCAQAATDLITIDELKAKIERKEKILILDARAGASYLGSSVQIRGAFHLTVDELEARNGDLPRDREIVVYCT